MTTELENLITALRIGDSQFPSGGFAFSWGLETLARQAPLAGRLAALMDTELEDRWAPFDRPIVALAMAAPEPDALIELDGMVEAMAWPAALRAGSARAGGGLVLAHARIGTPGAAALAAAVRDGRLRGHLPVLQGALYAGLGLSRPHGLALAGQGLLAALGSAAVRLGQVGALESQRIVAGFAPRLAELAAEAPPRAPCAFSPLTEIAMMRHGAEGAGGAALFSN